MTASSPFGDEAELHPDFTDPVEDESVPFVVGYDDSDPDPTPPAERIAEVENDTETKPHPAGGFFALGGGE